MGITEHTSMVTPIVESGKKDDAKELLEEILKQMKIMNLYLSVLTDTEFNEQDIY